MSRSWTIKLRTTRKADAFAQHPVASLGLYAARAKTVSVSYGPLV